MLVPLLSQPDRTLVQPGLRYASRKKQMIMPCRSMRDSRAEWFHTFGSVRLSTYGPTGLVVKRKPAARAYGHHNAVLSDSSFVLDGMRQAPRES